jgi:hypothetical protein
VLNNVFVAAIQALYNNAKKLAFPAPHAGAFAELAAKAALAPPQIPLRK